MNLDQRRQIIARANLYFVCEAYPGGGDPRSILDASLRGGVGLVQMRQKDEMSDADLIAAARSFREAVDDFNADGGEALFILNDRPDLVVATGADGVHVGQDDMSVAKARAVAGPEAVVGLSTHTPDQVIAAQIAKGESRPDQISVGPVWATPTKPGRPETGTGLLVYATGVAMAAGIRSIPWFAIGGIDQTKIDRIIAAGARRAVIVRAIRDAADPEAIARSLHERLGNAPAVAEDIRPASPQTEAGNTGDV